jgi:hypothetical protein
MLREPVLADYFETFCCCVHHLHHRCGRKRIVEPLYYFFVLSNPGLSLPGTGSAATETAAAGSATAAAVNGCSKGGAAHLYIYPFKIFFIACFKLHPRASL